MKNHCCEHECSHEQVKFCKGCRAVYCANCKQKWMEPCTQSHYPWTYTTTGTTTTYPVYSDTNPQVTWFAASDCGVNHG